MAGQGRSLGPPPRLMPMVTLIGGPHDGLSRSSTLAGATFVWCDGRRMARAPFRGSTLYKHVRKRGRDVWFVFSGLTTALCTCGAYRPRRGSCPLCGSEEVRA